MSYACPLNVSVANWVDPDQTASLGSLIWVHTVCLYAERTSDGGNGNYSVSLPIILIKTIVDQMLLSSYISSL